MFYPLVHLLSHSCQYPIGPRRTRQKWNRQNQSQTNPAIRSDGKPCTQNHSLGNFSSIHSHDNVVRVGLDLEPKDDLVEAVVEKVGGDVEHGAVPGGERAVDGDLDELLAEAGVAPGVVDQVHDEQTPGWQFNGI